MGSQLNSDSLFVKIGTTKAVPNRAGEFKTYGELREIEMVMDVLPLTSTSVIQSDQVFIPTGVRIEEVEVVVETACTSGGSATLDVGLMQTDRVTQVSNTTFVNGLAVASLTPAGTKLVLRVGSTSVGTGVGTTLANIGYITARFNTAAFTAGRVVVRIKYMKVL